MALSRIRNRYRNKEESELNITSLMDIYAVLIIFMLKSYSVSPDVGVGNASQNLKLPLSTSPDQVRPALRLSLTKENLLLEEEVVISLEELQKEKDMFIKPLFDKLALYKKKTDYIGHYNTDMTFKGEIILRMDKELDFSLLKRIMYTCGQSMYGSIHLMGISETT